MERGDNISLINLIKILRVLKTFEVAEELSPLQLSRGEKQRIQMIKEIYFSETGRGFSFLKKYGILSSIMMFWTLLMVPIRLEYLKIFIFVVGIAVFLTALLHVAIDRYTYKSQGDLST